MSSIARLRIGLDDVEPRVWRRVDAPLTIRLDDLHSVIQIVMPWENAHLFEFAMGRTRYGVPDPDWGFGDATLDASRQTLGDLLAGGKKIFRYTYDFGDDWRHTVKLERLLEPDGEVKYPRFVDGEGACPPEDVGGPWGYAAFLEALADPEHENHSDMMEWAGGPFDASRVEEDAIRTELKRFAASLLRRKPSRHIREK